MRFLVASARRLVQDVRGEAFPGRLRGRPAAQAATSARSSRSWDQRKPRTCPSTLARLRGPATSVRAAWKSRGQVNRDPASIEKARSPHRRSPRRGRQSQDARAPWRDPLWVEEELIEGEPYAGERDLPGPHRRSHRSAGSTKSSRTRITAMRSATRAIKDAGHAERGAPTKIETSTTTVQPGLSPRSSARASSPRGVRRRTAKTVPVRNRGGETRRKSGTSQGHRGSRTRTPTIRADERH